jgi:hypothetical protein
MEVTSRQFINPSEHQLFRHASQLVGNMAFDRGRFVGRKATGLRSRLLKRATHVVDSPEAFYASLLSNSSCLARHDHVFGVYRS